MARILLADDDTATRDFVRRALETDGHTVAVTQDGQEALDRIQADAGKFDLLITDVQMPGIDGISLIRQAGTATPQLRVLLMSGFTDELARAKGVKVAALRTISKPFTLEQLRSEVRAVLA